VLADAHSADQVDLGSLEFHDRLVEAAFSLIAPQLEDAQPGTPVDLPDAEGEVSELIMSLAMDKTPVGSIPDVFARLKVIDIEEQITRVRSELDQLPAEEQTSSPLFAQLLALQDERRKWEHRD
jgi:hypothetical protein